MSKNLDQLTDDELEQALIARKEKKNAEKNQKRVQYESLKDETITRLVESALAIEVLMKEFKNVSFSDMKTLHELLKEYSNRHSDGRGNFSIISSDNQMKVDFNRKDLGYFDERSKEAEKHIQDFITKRFVDDEATKDLITQLLERKKGQLDIKLVQKLYSMEDRFEDPNWKHGIKLLKESWQSSDTKDYINFYVKDADGAWRHISLSFSSK